MSTEKSHQATIGIKWPTSATDKKKHSPCICEDQKKTFMQEKGVWQSLISRGAGKGQSSTFKKTKGVGLI